MAVVGMTGAVYVSDVNTAPVSFSDETCSAVDAQRKRYQIDDPDLIYWDPTYPVLVEVNGVPVASGFTLEYAGGYVVFDEALGVDNEKISSFPEPLKNKAYDGNDANDEVTVSGKALTLIQAGGFFNWSVDGDADDAEATTFASNGWKEYKRVLVGWSGSAEAYWGDTQFFDSLGKTVVVKLFVDAGPSQKCLEGFAIINGDGIENPVDGLVQETVDFTGTGPLYIRL